MRNLIDSIKRHIKSFLKNKLIRAEYDNSKEVFILTIKNNIHK